MIDHAQWPENNVSNVEIYVEVVQIGPGIAADVSR